MIALLNFIAAILGFLGKMFGRTEQADSKRVRQLEDAAAAEAQARIEKIDAETRGASRADADRLLHQVGSHKPDAP